MTPDELRKTADEVFEFVHDTSRGPELTIGIAVKVLAMAAAIRASLPPADDGEPITADWHEWRLCDVKDERAFNAGVTTCYVCPHNDRFGLTERDGEWRLYSITLDEFDGSQTCLCEVRNRGDLRRLCAALGVPLTPTPEQRP